MVQWKSLEPVTIFVKISNIFKLVLFANLNRNNGPPTYSIQLPKVMLESKPQFARMDYFYMKSKR